MASQPGLNPVAKPFFDGLVAAFPKFKKELEILPEGHFEASFAAPKRSAAGAMICRSFDRGIWIRFAPPNAGYPVDSVEELLAVVDALFKEEALLVVIMDGDDWIGTTLIAPGSTPPLKRGQSAQVYSWSGHLDADVAATKPREKKKARIKTVARRGTRPSARVRKATKKKR